MGRYLAGTWQLQPNVDHRVLSVNCQRDCGKHRVLACIVSLHLLLSTSGEIIIIAVRHRACDPLGRERRICHIA